ncbi:hypothetical protein HK097_011603 [Rhizophlyctis rosea]|uniref:Uncharacterized protein n=1 Tax=Rhizophlyctis rosea TaxID=64517 RepID=A0AAD5S602_9FUNG|nr:hypothetical protein HK097_011603 [Rhizophlyctis rosea]
MDGHEASALMTSSPWFEPSQERSKILHRRPVTVKDKRKRADETDVDPTPSPEQQPPEKKIKKPTKQPTRFWAEQGRLVLPNTPGPDLHLITALYSYISAINQLVRFRSKSVLATHWTSYAMQISINLACSAIGRPFLDELIKGVHDGVKGTAPIKTIVDTLKDVKSPIDYEKRKEEDPDRGVFQNEPNDVNWDTAMTLSFMIRTSKYHPIYLKLGNHEVRTELKTRLPKLKDYLNPQKHKPLLQIAIHTGEGIRTFEQQFWEMQPFEVDKPYVLHATIDGVYSGRRADYLVWPFLPLVEKCQTYGTIRPALVNVWLNG